MIFKEVEAQVEKWMCELVAEMHMNRITQRKLAERMGVTHEYVCTILNGKREKVPADMEQRMRDAIRDIVESGEK